MQRSERDRVWLLPSPVPSLSAFSGRVEYLREERACREKCHENLYQPQIVRVALSTVLRTFGESQPCCLPWHTVPLCCPVATWVESEGRFSQVSPLQPPALPPPSCSQVGMWWLHKFEEAGGPEPRDSLELRPPWSGSFSSC